MADLNFSVGLLSQGAVGIETTYGVEKLCDVPFALLSETLTDQPTLLRPPVLDGRPQSRQANQGTTAIGGEVVMAARYSLANPFLTHWFGEYNATTKRYTHAVSTVGQSLTIAFRKGATVWAFFGCKIHQLVLNAALDLVTLAASVYATDFTDASALNTLATLHALVQPEDDVLFRHMAFAAGEQDTALTSLDALGFTAFTLTLGRPLDQVYTNEGRGAIEGAETERPSVTLGFTLPRHRSNVWQTWKTANTPLQLALTITNPAASVGEAQTQTWSFPQVEIATAAINLGGPGAVQIPVTLQASEAERVLRSSAVAAAAGNTLTILAVDAGAAVGTLTLTGVATDGETVTIGTRVYEVDTEVTANITAGRVRVNLEAQSVHATQTLTVDTQPTAGDTFTLGASVYTFQANGGLTNVARNIEIGTTLGATQTNIRNAVNRTGTPGTGYAALTVAHPDVTLGAWVANVATVTAIKGGVAGNSIATTETFTAVTNIFGGATLASGASPTAAQLITGLVTAITADVDAVVTAVDGAGDTLVATAKEAGTAGNALATTETLANGSWAAATLLGGTAGDNDILPYAVPGATVWINSPLNNGVAEVVTRTDLLMVLTDAAYATANAGHDGFDLVNEAAGAAFRIVARSPDLYMIESAA